MRPTGRLHLSHLMGALKHWTSLQDRYDCFYFVADWHALTSDYASTEGLTDNALDNVTDWLAAGIDPTRSTIFVQSMVPEHAELYLLLQMVVPIPWLERVPTYKEQPQPLLTPVSRLPGLDNRKMSKSYGNTIDLCDDEDGVVKKVRQMYTDPKRIRADIPGTVEGNPVFIYHDAFNTDVAEVEDLKTRYRAGAVGDVEVKTKLAKAVNAALEPMRERRHEILSQPDLVKDVVVEGSRRARTVAQQTIARVRDAVRLRY